MPVTGRGEALQQMVSVEPSVWETNSGILVGSPAILRLAALVGTFNSVHFANKTLRAPQQSVSNSTKWT